MQRNLFYVVSIYVWYLSFVYDYKFKLLVVVSNNFLNVYKHVKIGSL